MLFLMAPYVSADQGDWLVRLRGIGIVPDDSSTTISLSGTELAGSGVEVDSAIVPELDITYMVTDHIGVEVIAGIANHDVNLTGPGAALGGLGLTDGFKLFFNSLYFLILILVLYMIIKFFNIQISYQLPTSKDKACKLKNYLSFFGKS